MILETFAIYFTFATPANPLPDEIGHPQGALALATAAVSTFYCSLSYSGNSVFRLNALSPYTVMTT
jgi:hypothetical protein